MGSEWCPLSIFLLSNPHAAPLSPISPQIVSNKKITRPLLLMNDKPAGKGLITVLAVPSAPLPPLPAALPHQWAASLADNHQLCLE